MYENHWQMTAKPFNDRFELRYYYPAETHQGALLKLRYAIEQGRGAAALSGPAGIGKSLLVELLRHNLPAHFRPFVQCTFPLLPCADCLAYLAEELSGTRFLLTPDTRESLRRIEDSLSKANQEQRRPVLIIEEAQLLTDPQLLEWLRLLLTLPLAEGNPLTLLFVGQAQFLHQLSRLPALDQRVAMKCQLQTLDQNESQAYVQHRLRAVGVTRDLLDRQAQETLFELTQGIPRQINRLLDMAFLVGFAEDRQAVTRELLESVHGDLLCVV